MKRERINKVSLSKSAVIACLIAVTAVTSVGVKAYAAENNAGVNSSVTSENNEEHKFLIDSKVKCYKDFTKSAKVAGFNFKVPDYLVDGYTADSELTVVKINSSENYVTMSFSNDDEEGLYNYYSIDVFNENPKDAYEKLYKDNDYSTITTTSTEKTLDNIKGEDITITNTSKKDSNRIITDKMFAWEDNGIYYAINYNSQIRTKDEVSQVANLNNDEIIKITNSMKKPEDITNVKYFEKNNDGFDVDLIYDEEDLEKANSTLGFKVNFISDINSEYTLYDAGVEKNEDYKTPILSMFYRGTGSHNVELIQTKDSTEYNEIKDNKFILYKFDKDCKNSTSEKLTINNKDVYKIKEKSDERYAGASNEYNYIYVWENNGIYYKIDSVCQDSDLDKDLETIIDGVLKKL